jgi:hypothetical protein
MVVDMTVERGAWSVDRSEDYLSEQTQGHTGHSE